MPTYLMTNEPLFPLTLKSQILGDWRRLLRQGFRFEDYSPALHHHLTRYGRFYHEKLRDREAFWRHYFGASLERLQFFLERFSLIEADRPGDFGLAVYYHTEDLNRHMAAELEDVRSLLLETLAAITAEIEQYNILFLAHQAHANSPERPFDLIREEVKADYNPALTRVEVAVSQDIRATLAALFDLPALSLTQPALWALGRPTRDPRTGEPTALAGWDPTQALRRRQASPTKTSSRNGATDAKPGNTRTDHTP